MNRKHNPQGYLQQLDAGPGTRLVLLLGPGGSGKTRLLHRWISDRQEAPVVLVDLTPQEDSPDTFVSKLIHSLNGIVTQDRDGGARFGQPPDDLGLMDFDLEAKSALVLSILEESPQGTALIMDHFNRISDPDVLEITSTLLDYLPSSAFIVIASRSEPPLNIPRLRVRREVVEIEI